MIFDKNIVIISYLFRFRCPKTVENFCVHSRDGYYNGHIVHRVIKNFMIQTGDPQGKIFQIFYRNIIFGMMLVFVLFMIRGRELVELS